MKEPQEFAISPSTSHKEDSRSVQSGSSTTCSSRALKEALKNAIKIKKNLRTKSGASPANNSQTHGKKSTRSTKNIPTKGKLCKEQKIVDAYWSKLLNQTNNPATPAKERSLVIDPSADTKGYYTTRPVQIPKPSQFAQKNEPIAKRQIRGGVIEIVTTKAKKDARSLSPLAEKMHLRSPLSPVSHAKNLIPEAEKYWTGVERSPGNEAAKKVRRRREERIKENLRQKGADEEVAPKISQFVFPKRKGIGFNASE